MVILYDKFEFADPFNAKLRTCISADIHNAKLRTCISELRTCISADIHNAHIILNNCKNNNYLSCHGKIKQQLAAAPKMKKRIKKREEELNLTLLGLHDGL